MEHRTYVINVITVVFVVLSLLFLFRNSDVAERLRSVTEKKNQSIQVVSQNLGTVVTPGPLVSTAPVEKKDVVSISVGGVIAATNAERTVGSTASLSESAALDASADMKAKDILSRQYFDHVAPDGTSVSDLVSGQGYEYVRVGENLALGGFKTDEAVVTAWMNSPGHRANILDARYTDIGVGIARGTYKDQNVIVIVQHFGRPLSLCPRVDQSIRSAILNGQAELTDMSISLKNLQTSIDEKQKNGEDVSAEIKEYNAGVEEYDALYDTLKQKTDVYNAQVAAFNTCVTAAK